MDYIEVVITGFTDFDPEIVIAQLAEMGFESFTETETGIQGYISEDIYDEIQVRDYLKEISDAYGLAYTIHKIAAQNWNALWESAYEPVVIAGKCRVRAPFHESSPDIQYEIMIEPRMSFGTAHHETTSLMIELLMLEDVKGKSVLDMGCGTGVLAILAHKMMAVNVIAVDNDEWAYSNSLDNMEKNDAMAVSVLMGGAEAIPDLGFDLITANINRNVLLSDIPAYVSHLNTGGVLLLSGFYEEDLGQIGEVAHDSGLHAVTHKVNNRWVGAKFSK